MSNRHDEDDWSNDSASLFREARRAHDPTLAESTRLAAVLARIQAAKIDAPVAANRGADIAALGATAKKVASVSLGFVCIAAATFAFIRIDRPPPEPTRSATPPADAVASAPPPSALQPALVPSDEPSASAPSATPRDQARSRPRDQRRRTRASAEKQRTPRIEAAPVPERSSPTPRDNPTRVTVPENSDARHARTEPVTTVKAAAPAIPEVAPRATSDESNSQAAVTAAVREAEPTLPEAPPTELAMMKRIQSALRDADYSDVLALSAEHARRWPDGVFAREREGVRAIASCGENSDDAVLRAKRFLTAHPRAPVALRVRAACAAQLIKR